MRLALALRPAAGGMLRHTHILMKGLAKENFSTVLFAPTGAWLKNPPESVTQEALSIEPRMNLLHDWRTARQFASRLRFRFDLLHAHGLRAALVACPAACKAGIPCLFTAHNLLPAGSYSARAALAYLLRCSCCIVAVSEAVGNSLQQAGVPVSRIVVIPNGIPVQPCTTSANRNLICRECGLDPARPLVLGAGRLSREKGFDLLIAAAPALGAALPGLQIAIAGEGTERAALQHQIDNLPAGSASVHLLGYAEDLQPLLCAADLCVVPSRTEGQGMVALEAMAAFTPVLAARTGGLPDTLLHGKCGLLFEPENPAALAQTALVLLKHPDTCHVLCQAAREHVHKKHSAEEMVRNTSQLYQHIVNKKSSAEGSRAASC